MRTVIVIGWLVLAGVAAAAPRGRAAVDETPRATMLLRAEQMADDVQQRLRLPPTRKRSGWAQGGSGWSPT